MELSTSDKKGLFKLGSAIVVLAVLWLLWQYGTSHASIEIAMVGSVVVFVSWVIKFFINWKLCFLPSDKESKYFMLHIVHNALSLCTMWTVASYTHYVTFTGAGLFYIAVGAQTSFLVVGAYLLTHDKTFTPLKAGAYVAAFLVLAYMVLSGVRMASLWDAKVVEEKTVVISELKEIAKSKSKGRRFEVTVLDQSGHEQRYDVRYSTFKTLEENDQLVMKWYQGKTRYVYSFIEPLIGKNLR